MREPVSGDQERYLQLLSRHIRDVMWVRPVGGSAACFVTEGSEALLGVTGEELLADIGSLFRRVHPEDLPRVQEAGSRAEAGEPAEVEFRISVGGETRWIRSRTELVAGEHEPELVIGIAEDVTARRHAEAERERSERLLRGLADNIREVLWSSDPGFMRIDYISPSFESTWGHDPAPLYENPRRFLDFLHPEDRAGAERALEGLVRGEFDVEYRVVRPDGKILWIRARGFPVFDAEGGVERIAGIAEDITLQKESARRREAAVEEKELLLREIHHRVKNNLQIVSSLMRLQGRRTEQPEVRRITRQNESRVQSMAVLHDLLYRAVELSGVQLAEYIGRIGTHLLHLYAAGGRVSISIAGDQRVDLDAAVPCGLIATELISNAIRHAFPEAERGRISVVLEPDEENGWFSMTISDDGRGMPPAVPADRPATLGLQLVSLLARQLGATISQSVAGGTSTTLRVPLAGGRRGSDEEGAHPGGGGRSDRRGGPEGDAGGPGVRGARPGGADRPRDRARDR